ncbi:MAG: AAA family ATPase [Oscillospiraceae bacterium]
MENRILELSKSYSAILLTGPRQAGKTTVLRELAEKENIGRRYVTLDNLSERDLAKNDPALFPQLHKPPVLIDEVQYAPELFTYIKIHIDEHHKPGDFWMTGSQIFRLMRVCRNLWQDVWRCRTCSPMSQREIVGSPLCSVYHGYGTAARRARSDCSGHHARAVRAPVARLHARTYQRSDTRSECLLFVLPLHLRRGTFESSPAAWMHRNSTVSLPLLLPAARSF